MPTETKLNQKNAYSYEYGILSYWGVNPIKPKSSILYYIRYVIVLSTALILYGSIMVQTFLETRLEKIIGMLYFSMTEIVYICKLFNYLAKRKDVAKLDEFLSNDIFNCYTDEQQIYITKTVLNANRLARVFRILIALCILMYSLYPFIDDRLLPLDGWFPINVEENRYMLIFFQVFSVGLSSLINSSIDILTFGMMSIATAHYSIINNTLTGIRGGKHPVDVKRTVRHCAYYQVAVTSITDQIESVFSYGLLFQFLCSIIVICLTGFEMIVVPPKSAEFVMLVSYFILIMCQITLYCIFGHDLMIKSQEVLDGCYASEWNNYNPEIGRMLFIIMERSKRPIMLTAGKFFYLTIPTLMTIFRSSYSYFAVLQRLYTKQTMAAKDNAF